MLEKQKAGNILHFPHFLPHFLVLPSPFPLLPPPPPDATGNETNQFQASSSSPYSFFFLPVRFPVYVRTTCKEKKRKKVGRESKGCEVRCGTNVPAWLSSLGYLFSFGFLPLCLPQFPPEMKVKKGYFPVNSAKKGFFVTKLFCFRKRRQKPISQHFSTRAHSRRRSQINHISQKER